MSNYESLVGKVFLLPSHVTLPAIQEGSATSMPPGAYRILTYTGQHYQLELDGEQYLVDAAGLYDFATCFGYIRDL
jgi:hypothetical protein